MCFVRSSRLASSLAFEAGVWKEGEGGASSRLASCLLSETAVFSLLEINERGLLVRSSPPSSSLPSLDLLTSVEHSSVVAEDHRWRGGWGACSTCTKMACVTFLSLSYVTFLSPSPVNGGWSR